MTRQELIDEMYVEYCEVARKDIEVKWLTSDEFVDKMGFDSEVFDGAYSRWAACGYTGEMKPVLILPNDTGLQDENFNKLFDRYIEEKGLQSMSDLRKKQLKNNMYVASQKLLKSQAYRSTLSDLRNKTKTD